jgi:hypothetical protein
MVYLNFFHSFPLDDMVNIFVYFLREILGFSSEYFFLLFFVLDNNRFRFLSRSEIINFDYFFFN